MKKINIVNHKKKTKKNYNKQNRIEYLFLLAIISIIFGGLINTIFNSDDINYYENRTAYKLPKPSLSGIIKKSFQDKIEAAFSDQIPLSITMKKIYNFSNNAITNILFDLILKNDCNNRYIVMGNNTTTFGCDKNIVYHQSFVKDSKKEYDNRIKSINKSIKKTKKKVYIYYIEKDTDINFVDNKKSDMFSYLKKNIKTKNIYKFEVNSFEDFKENFYKTDHHWNYKGSYKAYKQLVKILTKDKPLKYKDEVCLNKNFSGTKANFSGASYFYKENFCAYTFDYPNYDIKVNGKDGSYGKEEYYITHPDEKITYGYYYGLDSGEIIFNNHNSRKGNILVIGESYDNAILKLLASHFNKTFSIDLRNYERENNKKFNYYNYIKKNDIDKVLLIGNRDYYKMEEFNLEV